MQVGLLNASDPGPIRGFVNVDWGSKCQKIQDNPYLFNRKPNLISLYGCMKEAIYSKRFIRELGFNSAIDLENLDN